MTFEVWFTWDGEPLPDEQPTEISMFPSTHDQKSKDNILGPGHHVFSHMIVADNFDDALVYHDEIMGY